MKIDETHITLVILLSLTLILSVLVFGLVGATFFLILVAILGLAIAAGLSSLSAFLEDWLYGRK